MIDISGILKSKNVDVSYEGLRKTELLCEKALELSDKYFETGKMSYLDDSVNNLTLAAQVNCRHSRIYISLCHTCIRLELFEEGKTLLSRVLEFDQGNLIAKNMLKIVNTKIAVNMAALKKREKASAKSGKIPAENFSKIFSITKNFSTLKVKVSESILSKFTKIFTRE